MRERYFVHDSIENISNYLEPNSVDLILTDPPYPKKYLPLWQILFDKSFVLLKEGGMLVTYSGHYYLPEIFRMRNNLKYVMTMALIHSGRKGVFHPSKVIIGWKPILVFVKGKMPEIPYYKDVVNGTGREKKLHKWQQAVGEVGKLIEMFSKPDDLVIDPFLGSGTTFMATIKTDRKFFGLDNDISAVLTITNRLGFWQYV